MRTFELVSPLDSLLSCVYNVQYFLQFVKASYATSIFSLNINRLLSALHTKEWGSSPQFPQKCRRVQFWDPVKSLPQGIQILRAVLNFRTHAPQGFLHTAHRRCAPHSQYTQQAKLRPADKVPVVDGFQYIPEQEIRCDPLQQFFRNLRRRGMLRLAQQLRPSPAPALPAWPKSAKQPETPLRLSELQRPSSASPAPQMPIPLPGPRPAAAEHPCSKSGFPSGARFRGRVRSRRIDSMRSRRGRSPASHGSPSSSGSGVSRSKKSNGSRDPTAAHWLPDRRPKG